MDSYDETSAWQGFSPDGLTARAISALVVKTHRELDSALVHEPTSAFADGSALERRLERMARREANAVAEASAPYVGVEGAAA